MGSERLEVPPVFEDAPVEHLIHLIGILSFILLAALYSYRPIAADMLERLMAHNDRIPLSPCAPLPRIRTAFHLTDPPSESLTRFHSRSAPAISVLDYLKRIVRFTNVEVRLVPSSPRPTHN